MLTKVFTIFAVAAAAHGVGLGPLGGYSEQHRAQDDFGRYNFGYHIVNGLGAVNGRKEAGVPYGPVVGSYYLGDIDGRQRVVKYVADNHGFRAQVQTNEPGTKTSLAAAAPTFSAFGTSVPAVGLGYGTGYSYNGGFGYGR
ncbi:adult-specific rigid cuticular protein 15.7-like [Ornithodoros turicata]|uniref:adult-specific rigid cuticular protein 15.7-like n=1 Tax=Ornithodoros turicata TaxID=34597 RepID=UPI0031387181